MEPSIPGAGGGWVQLVVRLTAEAEELAAELLFDLGAQGLERLDADSVSPPADLAAGWIELRASFPASGPTEALRFEADRLLTAAGCVHPPSALRALEPEDWIDNWRRHFRPIRAGRFFIHPPWISPEIGERFAVCIDPGLAFGTGLHPTTRLCLEGLDEALGTGRSVLDVGTGSGVLALAAARAGAEPVVACDDDPEACRVARENIERNALAGQVEVIDGPVDAVSGRFDVVLANILSGVLIATASLLVERLAPGGRLLLSGVLSSEVDEVIAAYRRCGLRLLERREMDDWCLLALGSREGSA